MVSYWKCACSPEITIEAGTLQRHQVHWWTDLISHGLREFFLVNRIDFRKANLFVIRASAIYDEACQYSSHLPRNEELVFVSGGKDSAFTLEFLKQTDKDVRCLFLNPSKAAIDVAQSVGVRKAITVERQLDRRLLELNQQGYLNGHTPFSAYLAFVGVFSAVIYGHHNIIVSNERSSAEPVARYLGADVIHQYSKTYRFESMLNRYTQRYLAYDAEFFSLLQPLHEIQVVKLFSMYPKHFVAFRSCNKNIKENTWCGDCAKCLSIFSQLYPFVSERDVIDIFGQNLFERENMIPLLQQILGQTDIRPLECIGAVDEILAALYLCVTKIRHSGKPLPPVLRHFESNILTLHPDLAMKSHQVLGGWSDEHNLPDEYRDKLQQMISRAVYEPATGRA
jgi:hypothetical protein